MGKQDCRADSSIGCAVLQVELTASDWDECGMWLTALKRLIKIRQTMG